ncbi:MAG: hypothetical protein DI538_09065 [Azospira oryzae]|nr:MAG: hypothetical protein DI538_09065 [Azospira oryzae]
MKTTRLLQTMLLLVTSFLQAQEIYQLQNRWKPNEYIHVEQTTPASGSIQPGWLSARWTFEPITGTGYYKIKNEWRNQYLHIQDGPLASGTIEPGWWSAQWSLEPVAGTTAYRLRNRWKPEIAIHNQNGTLEAGPVELGWWSAQWETVGIHPSTAPAADVQKAQATPSTEKRSNNPDAFTPQHNGTIVTAMVRYTDQISILRNAQVAKGNKIYFFPQEVVNINKDGLSFDPKNPAIGGQEFTVIETEPKLILDRPMPMMRNTNNSNFLLVAEIY